MKIKLNMISKHNIKMKPVVSSRNYQLLLCRFRSHHKYTQTGE